MDEKQNQYVRIISKRGLVIGLSAILLAGGGVTSFLLANQRDAKAMEAGMEQVSTQTLDTSVTPASVSSEQKDQNASKEENLWLDNHKIIVNSENPTDVAITATEAAKLGLDNIKNDTQQVDDDCDVELFHMSTAGVGKSTGVWIGVAILNDINRYEFRIDDATGEVIQRDDYVTEDSKFKWKKTNTSGTSIEETMINDQELEAFSKISANNINVADCEIVEGKSYGIYIKYNSNEQTAYYDSKDGVLTVKLEEVKNNRQHNNKNANITITVPEKTKFDLIDYSSSVGDLSIGAFEVNTIKVMQTCGGLLLKDTSYENAELSTDCGNAFFNGCKIKNTNLNANCGNIKFTDCTLSNMKGNADYGNILIKNSSMTDAAFASNCGNIEGINLTSKNLKLTAEYGNIQVVGDLAGINDFSSSMGSIAAGFSKDKTLYSYDLSVESGQIFLDDQVVSGKDVKTENSSATNRIKAFASMGNCSINFKTNPETEINVPESDSDSWDYGDGDSDDDYDDSWDDWNDWNMGEK